MRKYLACLFTLLTLVSATSSLSAEGQKNIRGAKVNLKIAAMDEALLQKSGIVSIVVELSDKSAIGVYKEALALRGDQKAAAAAGKMQNALIERAQNDFVNRLSTIASDAKILYRNKNVYNGVAMNVDASKLDAIRKMAGVKKLYLIHPKSPDLFNSVPFQNVPAAWVLNGGNTGTGIRVGIIDTGIDYVHANFGGNEDYINDTTVAGDNINYPSAKVVGGTDLVGDAYDANNPLSIPQPDDDPMDCNGHGSHVAGIAAGLGVTTGGTTYPGPYDGTTHSTFLRIGPGVAPGAKLYGIRVFGCAGSTNVTDAAIEWATDPNQDGDTSDHLDVINMSLGAGYGGPDDTSTIASNAAADLGMIVAISAGNAGDTYYILGSPGNASKAITVANSVDKSSIIGGLDINSPPSIAGVKPATEAVFGPDLAVTGPITGNVVLAIDGAAPVNDGCSALTNAAAIAGNIALIDRGICTFKAKVRNAQLAGAIGVIIANNTVAFPITMGDDPATPNPITIPSQMIFQADGTAIKANLPAPGVSATLSALHRNSVNANDVTIEDTLDASSSRGPARISSSLKPDITAVGNTVFSTLNGSGDQGLNISGTSMAAPHIAGAAALMKQLHPTWTPAEIKAALMNTATQDLFTGLNHTGVRYGDGRIGDGRLNMATASSTQVIAFNASDPTAVGLSFGSPAVVDTTLDPTNDLVINGHVTLKNFGATGVTYTPTIENSNTGTNVPGVAFVLPVPGPVTVPATGTSDVAVDLTIDSNVMTHVRDSSVANAQLTGFGNQPRHWLSEETGYLVLTPTPAGPPVLRVPLYVAPRPASAMTTVETSLDFDAATGAKTITPTGNAVTPDAAFPIGVESLVSVFENQENSPDDPTSNGASNNADLKNIGVNYDPNTDALSFGLVTYGNWSSPNEVTLRVYIDDDQDGIDDFFIENSDLGITNAPPNTTDVYWTLFCNADGTNCFFDDAINLLTSNVRDTVLMNTNAMFLSVFAGDLPITGSFNYHVRTFSRDAAGIVDESAVHTFDLSNPGLFTPTSPAPYTFAPMFQDKNAAPFSINYNTLAYQAQAGDGVLLIHHHNGGGFDRAQVLPIIVDANLSVTNTDFADPTFLGNDINYTIKVTNNGPAVATNVVLSDVLDAGTTFVASVPGCSGAGTVTCNLGDIAVGQTVTVTLAAKPIVAGTLTNSATATSDQNDPVPADNTGIATTTLVNDSGTSSHLTLDKTHTPSISTVGGFLGYLFDIRNTGPDDVLSVIVTDTLPDSVSFFNIATSQGFCDPPAGQVITCHLGNIHANEFANIVMTVIPNQAGFITNIATATASSNLDPTSQSTDTDVAQINPLNADLQITNTEDADPVTAGDNITYTVTVTNNGPDTAANVQMTDQLPVESAFQSGTTPLGWNCGFPIVGAMGGTVVCTKDPLNPLETATFTIVVQSTVGAGYSSTASVVASEPIDTNVANNSAVARTSVYRPSVSAATDCTSTDTTTFNSTPIQPQYNTLTSTMDVATPGTYLWDLDLVTFLDTDCGAVLNVKLTSPAGTEVTLSTQNGFCGPNAFFDTLWDDQANNPVTDFDFFSNQIHSPLTVEEALGAFNGEDPNGTWTITIEDFGGSITKLNEWSLRTSVFNQPPVNSHRDFTNNNSTPIPAIGQITSTMNVANSGKVCNLDAITNITHIENDELLITLTSPQGTQVTLSSFNGNVNSFSGTLWDDNAGATNPPGPVTDASFTPGFAVTPITPESAMAAFNGEDSTGTWTLTVSDVNLNPFELFFPAALNNWSLNVGTCSCGTSDIRLTKDDDPDPVQANDSLHYILTVYNDGPDDATGVRVTDNLPNGAVFVSASPECSASNGTVTCDVGALANGTNKVLDVYVQPTLSGVITNGACADNFEGDPNTVNNCDNETTTVQLNEPVHTDLSINKTDSADPTNVGASFSYTLSVTNNGPDESHGFTVTDTLPAEVTFVSASAECTNTAGTITCVSTGPVAEGATQSFLINVTANTQALVSNQACVTAVDIDTDPANNCDTETTQVDAGPTSNSDLSIDKTDNPDPVQVGASLHYTLTVTNNGPDDANNVVAVDTLHPSMTFVTASAGCTNNSGVVTCNMGTIINGGAAVADIYVVPTLAGPIPNTACVSGFVNDGTSGNNCDTEVTLVTLNAPGFTDLQLQKDDSADPVIATSNFSYTLTVTNNGPDESVGFTISDTLPPQVSYISASSGCSETAGVVTCVFNGNLANGGVASFQILVSADTAGDAVNSACVIADNSDTVAANNCDTEHTTIDPTPATSNADLSLDKTDSFDPLQVGSLLTYTLHIANNGPDNATSITVTDTLHPSTNFLSASPGCTFSAGIVTCSIASLANGASIDLQILVGTNLAGVITNTACVSADFNNDGDVSNNCDIENTTITLTPPIITDLQLTKTASAGSVQQGNNITYTLTVFNDGPDISTGHTITDVLPATVTFVSASPQCTNTAGTVKCQSGPLGNNASITFTVTVQATSAGIADNTACVAADNFDLIPANNCSTASTTIGAVSVDLSLLKTGSPNVVTVGNTLQYTLTVSNAGPNPSTGSTIADTLPGEVNFLNASAGCTHAAGVVTCNIGALTTGNSTSVTINVQVVATGTIFNSATVTGNENDPNTVNNTDTETTTANACVFCDDFEDSVIQPEGVWAYTPAITSWSEDGDNLVGVTVGKKPIQAIASPIFAGCQVCTVTASVATAGGAGNKLTIIGWHVDDKNQIELLMNQKAGKWQLRQRFNGHIAKKLTVKRPINVAQFYTAVITFNGSAFTVTIDGSLVITMNPKAVVPIGTVGFKIQKTTGKMAQITVN